MPPIKYTLKLIRTQAAAGYFQAIPENLPQLTDILHRLHQTPMDSFLHRRALDTLDQCTAEELDRHLSHARKTNDTLLSALICEALFISKGMKAVRRYFSTEEITSLLDATPLIPLRSALAPNRRLHAQWIRKFKDNLIDHAPLPPLSQSGLPPLCAGECGIIPVKGHEIKNIHKEYAGNTHGKTEDSPTVEETTQKALDALDRAGVGLEAEMRHQSSLSPVALLRKWRFCTTTETGRHRFTLSGTQTSYGRGLSLEQARVSLAMEIVERCAAFSSVSPKGIVGTRIDHPLVHDTLSGLKRRGIPAIDPEKLALEVPYRDEPLYWTAAEPCAGEKNHPVMVPVQHLFLFSNLDEVDLFSGLGSTGLASGSTLAQAKVSALLEIIERHQEATVPFDPATCFRLVARDGNIGALMEAFACRGIDVLFQDITPASGIPCCKCFVKDRDGTIHKGTAAHLNARQAIVSALTETPYPFPDGPPSQPFGKNFTLVGFDALPDYSTGRHESDLLLLETLLQSWGKIPCYVDITRKDMEIPVVRAIVPGMEIMGDFDLFSRVHPELFQNYLSR